MMRFWEIDQLSYKEGNPMERMFCKECRTPIVNACDNAQCAYVRALGFCSNSCQEAYIQEKEFHLRHA